MLLPLAFRLPKYSGDPKLWLLPQPPLFVTPIVTNTDQCADQLDFYYL